MIFCIFLLLTAAVAEAAPLQDSNECESCSWQLAFHHDQNGNRIAGWKSSLISAVLSGARVRVVIGTTYSAEADNVHVYSNHVFAQLLQHVSKASWDKFQDNVYWWWVIVSTDGLMQMTRYNVGSNDFRGDSLKQTGIKWYVQTFGFIPEPIYSNLANGTAVRGNLNDLVSSVQSGHDIRCVTDKKYNFPIQNVAVNTVGQQYVSGQNVDHVSVTTTSNQIQFQSNAYWWFSIVTTSGIRDMSRWTVGLHQPRGHTQDRVAMEWFADGCWKEIYSHDGKGKRLSGSRSVLTSALLSGHRVRFQVPGWNYYTAEADNLSLRNGHVTAQALKHVSKSGVTGFQEDAYWWWVMVSTTGTIRATRYKVGVHVPLTSSTYSLNVKWFVDTRSWELTLSNDAHGAVLSGSQGSLMEAVKAGRDVRCVQGNEVSGYVYKAQNLAVSGNHVAAQSLNHVSMMNTNSNEVMIQPNAYWWFTIVSTTGLREMSRWTVGEHQDRGHTSDKVAQKWFVN